MSATLAVGTTNPGKVAAVNRALEAYAMLTKGWVVAPHKVASGVSDQPITLEETTQGAKNRALAAAAAAGGGGGGSTVLGIGIESGLFEVHGKMFDVCACVVYDGTTSHIGYSGAWELPESVRTKVVNEGQDLSQAFQHISADPNIGDKGGAIAVMSGERITRPDYTVQAIQMAIIALNPAHYSCSPSVPAGINDTDIAHASALRRAQGKDGQTRGFLAGVAVGVIACVALGRRVLRFR